MRNSYKQALDKIIPSQELVETTAAAMKRMQKNEKNWLKWPPGVRYYVVAAACLVAVFLLTDFVKTNKPGSDIFVTKLSAGRHMEYVELADGFLSFSQEDDTIFVSPPIALGGRDIIKKDWDITQYMEYLGADIAPGYLPEGMILEKEAAVVYLSQDGRVLADIGTFKYMSANGQSLLINIAKDNLPAYSHMDVNENSRINGHPVTAGVNAYADIYWAQFIKDGVGYYIESEKLNQEEFIMIIYHFLL